MSIEASLEILKRLFSDKPDALKVFNLENLEPEYLKEKFRSSSELFASSVNMYVTGRTGAGKTTLGNCLLSETTVMDSNGFQNCTKEVGWFQLASNLRYYDLPGIADDVFLENINRATLLMPQLEDEFAEPPVVPLSVSDELKILDFTKCKSKKDKPEEEIVTVDQWQSDEQQKDVEPDVIIYVFAPHGKFLQPDRKYLGELLKTWKARKNRCIIITALNVFRKDDGTIVPTPQEMEYARTEIPKVYRAVHKNEWIPPIVEINSKTGEGINEVTEIICQVLPTDKIGNMHQVLRDELKQFAEQERINRYYRTLSLIAGRLAGFTVDKKLEGQNLFQAAALAITAYGVMTFKNAEAVAEIKAQVDSIREEVERIEEGRQEAITEKEDVMGTKDITRIVPKIEEVTLQESTYIPETRTRKRKEEVDVPVIKNRKRKEEIKEPKIKTRTVDRKFLGIKFGERKEQYLDYEKKTIERNESYVDYEKKTVERDETYIDYVEKTIERVETRIVGYEEEVVGTVQVVVAQVEKVVGTQYLTGGYPAIEFLLGLGLGVQSYCSHQNHSPNFSACIEQGERLAERKLEPFKSQIEQLVDNPKGERELIQREQQLIQILEQALVS